ncbi:hypothetical protein BGX29_001960 [Mortierella sp. GBA35]|nr:hypothetical protein BGX29_001960 [Mortierella sp. GBA35]
MIPHITIFSTTIFLALFSHAGTLCDKPNSLPTNNQPDIPNSGFSPLSPWPPIETLAVTPRFKPIYKSDESVGFIIDVPACVTDTQATLNFGTDSQVFEASVHPGTNIVSVPQTSVPDHSTIVTVALGSLKAKASFAVYQRPVLGKSHTVRVDYLHGSLVFDQVGVSSASPVFPFGMYVNFGNFGAKDPVGAIKELKAMGFNHANFVPPYEDGVQIKAILEAAQGSGVSVQYDMRHTYSDPAKVTAEVNSVKAFESLGTWYTADEPDGESKEPEPQTSINAYNTIQSIDPHRPVMLVLNHLRHSAAQFSQAVDVLMTDVYPIGISKKVCNAEVGCCGCDGCVGDFAEDLRRRLRSYRSQLIQVGKPRMPVWMVLQAFSDPNTCWSRAPRPVEYELMSYLSLIHGAKGLMGWIYPTGFTPELKALMPKLAAQIVSLGSRFILQGDQTVEYFDSRRFIAAGAWTTKTDGSKLFIVVNTGIRQVTLTDAEVAAIFGQDSALVEGRRTLDPESVSIITIP